MSSTQDNKPMEQGPVAQGAGGFVASHCRHCAAGWTRTGAKGGILTVCLLDREPVLADMTSCDRYEPRAEPEA